MELTEVAQALSSDTRVRLLQIVSEQPITSSAAHERYQAKYSSPTRRESIYRELEKLVDAGLVVKEYQNEQKYLVYSASCDEIQFDISNSEVEIQ